LLETAGRPGAWGEAGPRFCAAHRGAAQRQLAVCLELLKH
jgi:hypothetical protein